MQKRMRIAMYMSIIILQLRSKFFIWFILSLFVYTSAENICQPIRGKWDEYIPGLLSQNFTTETGLLCSRIMRIRSSGSSQTVAVLSFGWIPTSFGSLKNASSR